MVASESAAKPIVLYMSTRSTPCRAVWMTCKALGINFKITELNLTARDHMSKEFQKINPQHCVPTIDDNGFYLWESHAIMEYLCDKYAKDEDFYPRSDIQKRAIIHRLMYFDLVPLYYSISQWMYPQLCDGSGSDLNLAETVRVCLQYLEEFLKPGPYVAGEHFTVADIAILASVTFLEIKRYNFSAFPRIFAWLQRLKSELPYFDDCNIGLYNWQMFTSQQEFYTTSNNVMK